MNKYKGFKLDTSKYGPWALVTGAAQGLGAEFSRQLAAQGLDIVLVDINEDLLKQTADTLKSDYQIGVRTICLDLASEKFMPELLAQIEGLTIGLLVNNAGISKIGHFLPQSASFLLHQLHLNTRAVLLLSHHFSEQMAQMGRGGIIILSSGAAEMSSAYNANYCATKAYDLKLAESLWQELKPKGIDVLGFMPGSTHTEGYEVQAGDMSKIPLLMNVGDTVNEALFYLGKRPSVCAGRANRIVNFVFNRLLPRRVAIETSSKQLAGMFRIGKNSG